MKAIVAVDKNWGIGKNNGMLFRLPLDLKFFRKTTLSSAVVMGRKTLMSFPDGKPLAGRVNIVLSRAETLPFENILHVKTEAELFCELKKHGEIFVIGGGEVYRLLLPYCEEALVTKVDADGGAEVFFENLDETTSWRLIGESEEIIDNGFITKRCVYKNNNVKKI